MYLHSVGTPSLWVGFTVFVLAMLVLDVNVFQRKTHEVTLREAQGWTCFRVALAALFGAGVYIWFGAERALAFATGFVIEQALSVDNLFVFLLIFTYFKVPAALAHRVLFWGVLGAIAIRALFILLGTAMLHSFRAAMYLFGGLLVLASAKLILQRSREIQPDRSWLVRAFRKVVPTVAEFRGSRFLVVEGGKTHATLLLLVLVVVEVSDITFSIDSIPAVFAVTTDPFIVFTSNVFALLTLRALYFVLAGATSRFHYLKPGLAGILAFVGVKMLVADFIHISVVASLGVVMAVLGVVVLASFLCPSSTQHS